MSKAELETRVQQWLEDNHEIVHNPPLGANQCSIEYEKARQRGIFDELNKIGSKDLNRQVKDQCALNANRVRDNIVSLDYIGKIAGLEGLFSKATAELLGTAHQLSTEEVENLSEVCKPLLGSVQRCWQWVELLSTLSRLHLRNAADYNAFHVECHDARERLTRNFGHALRQQECLFHLSHTERTKRLLANLTDSLKHCLTDWEAVDHLLAKSHSIVPVAERLGKPRNPSLKAICACKYETPEFRISEGDEVVLLDNSDKHLWRVALDDGCEVQLPSVMVWIPPCDAHSVEKGIGLRKKFSDMWTDLLEKFRVSTVVHLNGIFSHFLDRQTPIQVSDLSKAHELFELIKSTILADEPTDGVQNLARLLDEVKARTVHKDQVNAALGRDPRLRPENVHFPSTELVRLHTIVSKLWQHLRHWTEFQESGSLPHWSLLHCVQHGIGQHRDSGRLVPPVRSAEEIEQKLAHGQDELRRLQNSLNAMTGPRQCRKDDEPIAAPPLIGHLDLGDSPGLAAKPIRAAASTQRDAATDTGSVTELLMQLMNERREFARAALRREARQRETATQTSGQDKPDGPSSCSQSNGMGGFAQVSERSVECQLAQEQLATSSANAGLSLESTAAHTQTEDKLFDLEEPAVIDRQKLAMAPPVESSDAHVLSGPTGWTQWAGQVGAAFSQFADSCSQAGSGYLNSAHQQVQSGLSNWQTCDASVIARDVRYSVTSTSQTDSVERDLLETFVKCRTLTAVAETQSRVEQAVQSCQASVDTLHASLSAHLEIENACVHIRQPSVEADAWVHEETCDASTECIRIIEDAESAWTVPRKDEAISIRPAKAITVDSQSQTFEAVTRRSSLATQCSISACDSAIQSAAETTDFEVQMSPEPMQASSTSVHISISSIDGGSQTHTTDVADEETEYSMSLCESWQQTEARATENFGMSTTSQTADAACQSRIACVEANTETKKITSYSVLVQMAVKMQDASTESSCQLASDEAQTNAKLMRHVETDYAIEMVDNQIQTDGDFEEEVVETYVVQQQAIMPMATQSEDFASQTEVNTTECFVRVDRPAYANAETDTGRASNQDSVKAEYKADAQQSSVNASVAHAEVATATEQKSTEFALQWELTCSNSSTETEKSTLLCESVGLQTENNQVEKLEKETNYEVSFANAAFQTPNLEYENVLTIAHVITADSSSLCTIELDSSACQTEDKAEIIRRDVATAAEWQRIDKECICHIAISDAYQQTDAKESKEKDMTTQTITEARDSVVKVEALVLDASTLTDTVEVQTADKETVYTLSMSDATHQTESEMNHASIVIRPDVAEVASLCACESCDTTTQTITEARDSVVKVGALVLDASTLTDTVEVQTADKETVYTLSMVDSAGQTEVECLEMATRVEPQMAASASMWDAESNDMSTQTLYECTETLVTIGSTVEDKATEISLHVSCQEQQTDSIVVDTAEKQTEYNLVVCDAALQTEGELIQAFAVFKTATSETASVWECESTDMTTQTITEARESVVKVGALVLDASTLTDTVEVQTADKETVYTLSMSDATHQTESEMNHASIVIRPDVAEVASLCACESCDTTTQTITEARDSVVKVGALVLDASTLTDTVEVQTADKETVYTLSMVDSAGQTEVECLEMATRVEPQMAASASMWDAESNDMSTQTLYECTETLVTIGSTVEDKATEISLHVSCQEQQTDSIVVDTAEKQTEYNLVVCDATLQTEGELIQAFAVFKTATSETASVWECESTDMTTQTITEARDSVVKVGALVLDASTLTDTVEVQTADKETVYTLSMTDATHQTESEMNHASIVIRPDVAEVASLCACESCDTTTQTITEARDSVVKVGALVLDASTLTDTVEVQTADKETVYTLSMVDSAGQTEVECLEMATKVEPQMAASASMWDAESNDMSTQTLYECTETLVTIGSTVEDKATEISLHVSCQEQQTDSIVVDTAEKQTEYNLVVCDATLQTEGELIQAFAVFKTATSETASVWECESTDMTTQTITEARDSVVKVGALVLDASTLTDTVEVQTADKETVYTLSMTDATHQTESEMKHASIVIRPDVAEVASLCACESCDTTTQTITEARDSVVKVGALVLDASTLTDTVEVQTADKETVYTLSMSDATHQTESEMNHASIVIRPDVAEVASLCACESCDTTTQTITEARDSVVKVGALVLDASTLTDTVEVQTADKETVYTLSMSDATHQTESEMNHASIVIRPDVAEVASLCACESCDTTTQTITEARDSVVKVGALVLDASTLTDTVEVQTADKETVYTLSMVDSAGQTEVECLEMATRVEPQMAASASMWDAESNDMSTQTLYECTETLVTIGSTVEDKATEISLHVSCQEQQTDSIVVDTAEKQTEYNLVVCDAALQTEGELIQAFAVFKTATSETASVWECESTDMTTQTITEARESVVKVGALVLDASTLTDTVEVQTADKETVYTLSMSDATHQTESEMNHASIVIRPDVAEVASLCACESCDTTTQTITEARDSVVKVGALVLDASTLTDTVEVQTADKETVYTLSMVDSAGQTEVECLEMATRVEPQMAASASMWDAESNDMSTQTLYECTETLVTIGSTVEDKATEISLHVSCQEQQTDSIVVDTAEKQTEYNLVVCDATLQTEGELIQAFAVFKTATSETASVWECESTDMTTQTITEARDSVVKVGALVLDASTLTDTVEVQTADKETVYTLSMSDATHQTENEMNHASIIIRPDVAEVASLCACESCDTTTQTITEARDSVVKVGALVLDASTLTDTVEVQTADKETVYTLSMVDSAGQTEVECLEMATRVEPQMAASASMWDAESNDMSTQTLYECTETLVTIGSTVEDKATEISLHVSCQEQQTDSIVVDTAEKQTEYNLVVCDATLQTEGELIQAFAVFKTATSETASVWECESTDMTTQTITEARESVVKVGALVLDASTLTDTVEVQTADKETVYTLSMSDATHQTESEMNHASIVIRPDVAEVASLCACESCDTTTQTITEARDSVVKVGALVLDASTLTDTVEVQTADKETVYTLSMSDATHQTESEMNHASIVIRPDVAEVASLCACESCDTTTQTITEARDSVVKVGALVLDASTLTDTVEVQTADKETVYTLSMVDSAGQTEVECLEMATKVEPQMAASASMWDAESNDMSTQTLYECTETLVTIGSTVEDKATEISLHVSCQEQQTDSIVVDTAEKQTEYNLVVCDATLQTEGELIQAFAVFKTATSETASVWECESTDMTTQTITEARDSVVKVGALVLDASTLTDTVEVQTADKETVYTLSMSDATHQTENEMNHASIIIRPDVAEVASLCACESCDTTTQTITEARDSVVKIGALVLDASTLTDTVEVQTADKETVYTLSMVDSAGQTEVECLEMATRVEPQMAASASMWDAESNDMSTQTLYECTETLVTIGSAVEDKATEISLHVSCQEQQTDSIVVDTAEKQTEYNLVVCDATLQTEGELIQAFAVFKTATSETASVWECESTDMTTQTITEARDSVVKVGALVLDASTLTDTVEVQTADKETVSTLSMSDATHQTENVSLQSSARAVVLLSDRSTEPLLLFSVASTSQQTESTVIQTADRQTEYSLQNDLSETVAQKEWEIEEAFVKCAPLLVNAMCCCAPRVNVGSSQVNSASIHASVNLSISMKDASQQTNLFLSSKQKQTDSKEVSTIATDCQSFSPVDSFVKVGTDISDFSEQTEQLVADSNAKVGCQVTTNYTEPVLRLVEVPCQTESIEVTEKAPVIIEETLVRCHSDFWAEASVTADPKIFLIEAVCQTTELRCIATASQHAIEVVNENANAIKQLRNVQTDVTDLLASLVSEAEVKHNSEADEQNQIDSVDAPVQKRLFKSASDTRDTASLYSAVRQEDTGSHFQYHPELHHHSFSNPDIQFHSHYAQTEIICIHDGPMVDTATSHRDDVPSLSDTFFSTSAQPHLSPSGLLSPGLMLRLRSSKEPDSDGEQVVSSMARLVDRVQPSPQPSPMSLPLSPEHQHQQKLRADTTDDAKPLMPTVFSRKQQQQPQAQQYQQQPQSPQSFRQRHLGVSNPEECEATTTTTMSGPVPPLASASGPMQSRKVTPAASGLKSPGLMFRLRNEEAAEAAEQQSMLAEMTRVAGRMPGSGGIGGTGSGGLGPPMPVPRTPSAPSSRGSSSDDSMVLGQEAQGVQAPPQQAPRQAPHPTEEFELARKRATARRLLREQEERDEAEAEAQRRQRRVEPGGDAGVGPAPGPREA